MFLALAVSPSLCLIVMLPGCDPGDCVVAVVVAFQFVSIWGQILAVGFYIFLFFALCDYYLRSIDPAERVLRK